MQEIQGLKTAAHGLLVCIIKQHEMCLLAPSKQNKAAVVLRREDPEIEETRLNRGKLTLLTDINYMVMIRAILNSTKLQVLFEGAYLTYYMELGNRLTS